MTDQTTCIPWQSKKEWQALTPSFDTIKKVHHKALDPLYQRAEAIRQSFESLSQPMDDLCTATCINCQDICCKKATIWFDFKDLLYLYFAFDRLPDAQILKNKDHTDDHFHCGHFSATGCLLSRLERPFVCTWYLCPDQKRMLMSKNDVNNEVVETISHIKKMRNEMESEFCEISAGTRK